MGLGAWGVNYISGNGSQGSPVYLFISVFVGVILYFATLWMVGEVKVDEKKIVLATCNSILRRETNPRN